MNNQKYYRLLIRMSVCLALSFGLISCVGTQLDKGLAALNGKPIETAFRVLGYPSRKMELGKNTVYYWSQSHVGMLPMPATAQSFGMVGTTPVRVTTSYTDYMPTNLYGEIQIEADSSGLITSHSYNGNNGGLAGFASSLGKYARSVEKVKNNDSSGSVINQVPSNIPRARAVPGELGLVYSPKNPKKIISVVGLSSGSKAKDPETGELFYVP